MSEFKFVSLGFNEESVRFFNQLLKLYTPKDGNFYEPKLNNKWLYMGNFDSQQAIFNMGSDFSDADVLFIDMDNEYGKRAWYILQAFFDEYKMIAVTGNVEYCGSQWIIQKSTLNWLSGQGTNIIDILNKLTSDTIN